jgi:hypothetical protein
VKKIVLAAAGLLLAAMTSQAVAFEHNDRPSCYIYVHSQCFPPGQEPKCSQPDYEEGLDECDGYYPLVGKRPGGLVSNPSLNLGKLRMN